MVILHKKCMMISKCKIKYILNTYNCDIKKIKKCISYSSILINWWQQHYNNINYIVFLPDGVSYMDEDDDAKISCHISYLKIEYLFNFKSSLNSFRLMIISFNLSLPLTNGLYPIYYMSSLTILLRVFSMLKSQEEIKSFFTIGLIILTFYVIISLLILFCFMIY